MSKADLNI